jgi:excisionase family DNA binding protein
MTSNVIPLHRTRPVTQPRRRDSVTPSTPDVTKPTRPVASHPIPTPQPSTQAAPDPSRAAATPLTALTNGRPTERAVYTVAEAAYLLSLSLGSTYALVRKGEIPALKLGGRWVIPIRAFQTWLDNLPTANVDDLDRELAALERADARAEARQRHNGA